MILVCLVPIATFHVLPIRLDQTAGSNVSVWRSIHSTVILRQVIVNVDLGLLVRPARTDVPTVIGVMLASMFVSVHQEPLVILGQVSVYVTALLDTQEPTVMNLAKKASMDPTACKHVYAECENVIQ